MIRLYRWTGVLLGVMVLQACAGDDRPRRIAAAKAQWERSLGPQFPPAELFFRAFKREKRLEAWVAEKPGAKMRLLRTWPVAGASGVLGPKRMEGDRQVPEGFYLIDRFNPKSRFHLSLGLNYPNASDRIRGDQVRPGGDIFIHGDTVSIGCLAMTDPAMEEIYALAASVRPRRIDVHIFPGEMNTTGWAALRREHPSLVGFWSELRPAYLAFERNRRVPRIQIASDGSHHLVK